MMPINFPDHLNFFFCIHILFYKCVQKPPGNPDGITCSAIGTLGFLLTTKKNSELVLGRTESQGASLRKGFPPARSGYGFECMSM